jgi:hypothetical protein
VFGDSTGLVFGLSGAEHAQELNITVGGAASLGCSVVHVDHMSDGRVITDPKECGDWEPRWRAILRREPHAVIALMTGAWDVLDHRTSTGVVRFGTPEWTNLVTLSLRSALQVLTTGGRAVHVFEVPCYGGGDPNFPLPERGDSERVAALNGILERLAAEMPHVEMVRWRTLVCPNGHRVETLDGVRLWKSDDVHLTEAGSVLVWKWWLPQLRAER